MEILIILQKIQAILTQENQQKTKSLIRQVVMEAGDLPSIPLIQKDLLPLIPTKCRIKGKMSIQIPKIIRKLGLSPILDLLIFNVSYFF